MGFFYGCAQPCTIKGKPAHMVVVRNDGFCWGIARIDGTKQQLDVFPKRDYYDSDDATAHAAFERWANRHKLEPAHANVEFKTGDDEPAP